MKNKNFYQIIIVIIIYFFNFSNAHSDQFQFDVTELEILNNGNLFKGLKRGTVKTNDGIVINANKFLYDKIKNIVIAEGKVTIEDKVNKNFLYSDKITYKKNQELIFTEGNSKATDDNKKIITAENFTYDKISNIIIASNNAKIQDDINENIINAAKITYYKNDEKIVTQGITEATIQSEYNIKSKNVLYLVSDQLISSKFKSTLRDNNSNIYQLDEFKYEIDKYILKGINILAITNFNLPDSDKFYFSEGIFNLKSKEFAAKDTEIEIHKNVFNNNKNDPRMYAVSSKGKNNIITLKKGIFTSCQKKDGCPPWTIKSEEIKHDKQKKQISYKNAFLNIYDIPVLYFPKFFHPDPSVVRQSGILIPTINNSNVLGNSLSVPYFKVISDNKDFTFSPTWFDNHTISLQNEYRQANKNSNFIADFGVVKGYKSPTSKKKSNMSHIFANYDLDLNLDQFNSSNLFISVEQVTNDTYLKVFDAHITKSEITRPDNLNILNNEIKLSLNHENYNFETGFHAYEDLTINKSDRYQYILPYYNFDSVLDDKYFNGSISISSSGSNNLYETNNLKSNIINDLNYTSENYITQNGFINNFNINMKNLNSLGKKNSDYKSSPQIELVSLLEANTSLPLINKQENHNNYLTPKISFRLNPSDMKDYSSSVKKIDTGNIFSLNRLGLNDTFETGRSLTLGLDYKREKKDLTEINNFFEVKLGTVIRDKKELSIPKTSTINKKNSNLFGSISNTVSENFKLNYNFALDNDFNTFEYNELNTTFSINNLLTTFSFIDENGEIGNSSIFENLISYTIDDNNFLTFKTRRNRKINLTEYYDLVYEYKNDCLTAGIKYKKSYYEDRDLKPTENLLFTITLFPLTTYEYEADKFLEN